MQFSEIGDGVWHAIHSNQNEQNGGLSVLLGYSIIAMVYSGFNSEKGQPSLGQKSEGAG
jgi:hypothetical protein